MINTIKKKLKENFFKNLFILISGTVLSQGLIIFSTPLITRLYSPKEFGILALFTSISSICAIISTGRYELAIGLPKKNSDARVLVTLVLIIGFIISSFYLSLIFILKRWSIYFSDFEYFIDSSYVFMVPIFTFFAAVISSLQYFAQRNKKYKLITIGNFIQTIVTIILSIIFAFLFPVVGALIYSYVLGQFCSLLYYLLNLDNFRLNFDIPRLVNIAKLNINFPKFMLLSDLAFTVTQQFIPILFAIIFNSTIVGFYSLANRILKIPSIVLGSSISNVFRNEVIDWVQMNKDPGPLYRETFKKLLWISAPIFLIVGIFSPHIFVFIFGQKWEFAGKLAQLLSIMIFFDFISSPFNSLFYIFKKQDVFMLIQVVRTIVNILSIFFGFLISLDSYRSLILFVISDIFFSCFLLIYTNKKLVPKHEL